MLGLFACCVALGVCVCVCVCLFTVDQHVSNEPLSLSTLDRTPIFTGVCKKKKKKEEEEKKQNPQKISFSVDQNSNFEVNFLRLSLKQLRNHSPIYPDCVDAQTFHPTCFYPADGSLSGILFLTMCEITPLFIWMKSEGKPCRVTWVLLTCPSHAARVSRLKKRGGNTSSGSTTVFSPFLHCWIVICFLSPILHPSPAEHIVIINNHHLFFPCIVR